MNEVDSESAEPCKLTIFDAQGNETLSYQFESYSKAYLGVITFLRKDSLALCLPIGEMWKWRWSPQDQKWKLKEKLTIPKGPFSAIEHSPNGKMIWISRNKAVITIDTSTGETAHKYDFDIGESKSEFWAWPITAIKLIHSKQILAIGFNDGRIALMPIYGKLLL